MVEDLQRPLVDEENPEALQGPPEPPAAGRPRAVTCVAITGIVVVALAAIRCQGIHISYTGPGYEASCDAKSPEFNYTQERLRVESCTWEGVNQPFHKAESGIFSVAGTFALVYQSGLIALPFIFKPDAVMGKRGLNEAAIKSYAEIEKVLSNPAKYSGIPVCWSKRLNNLVFFIQFALFIFHCFITAWFQRPYAWDVAQNDFSMTFRVQLVAPVVALIANGYALARTFHATYSGTVKVNPPIGFIYPAAIAFLPLLIYLPAVLIILLVAEMWWLCLKFPLFFLALVPFVMTCAVQVSYVQDWHDYWWVSVCCVMVFLICPCCFWFCRDVSINMKGILSQGSVAPLHRRPVTEESPKKGSVPWFQDIFFIMGLMTIVLGVSVFTKRAVCANSAICTRSTFTLVDMSLPSATSSFSMDGSLVDAAIIIIACITIVCFLRASPMDTRGFIGLSNARVLWRVQYVDRVELGHMIWFRTHQIVDIYGQTPLLGACLKDMHSEQQGTGEETVESLNQFHSDALKQMLDELRNESPEVMELMLEKKPWGSKYGAKDTENYTGFTALLVAAQNGYHDRVTTLLKYRADVNAQNEEGDTALMLAAKARSAKQEGGHVLAVQAILGCEDCEVIKENHNGETALISANDDVNIAYKILDVIVSRGLRVSCEHKDFSVLVTAIHKGHVELVQKCIEAGAALDFRAQKPDHDPPLMIAAKCTKERKEEDRYMIFEHLLKAGAKTEAKSGEDGMTVLMQVAIDNSARLVEVLHRHGAKADTKDKKMRRALDHAIYNYSQAAKTQLEILYGVTEYPRTPEQDRAEWEESINVGVVGATSSGKSTWINHQCGIRAENFKKTEVNMDDKLLSLLEERNDGKFIWLQAATDWPDSKFDKIKKEFVLFCIVPLMQKGDYSKQSRLASSEDRTKLWTFSEAIGDEDDDAQRQLASRGQPMKEKLEKFITDNSGKQFRIIFTPKRAALMGSAETTMKADPFKSDTFSGVTIWDLPGMGTRNFPKESYFTLLGLKYYDTLILICEKFLTEDDEMLLQLFHRHDVPCIILCNKIDIEIDNNSRDFFMEPHETISLIKESFMESRCKGDIDLFDEDHVFFTSVKDLDILADDRKRLKKTIEDLAKKKA